MINIKKVTSTMSFEKEVCLDHYKNPSVTKPTILSLLNLSHYHMSESLEFIKQLHQEIQEIKTIIILIKLLYIYIYIYIEREREREREREIEATKRRQCHKLYGLVSNPSK